MECARCAILKSTLKPKTAAVSAVEIAEALKASKDGRLPSDYYGEATGNLGLSNYLSNLFVYKRINRMHHFSITFMIATYIGFN